MSAHTKIAWCDRVWNPVTGCTKVSQGCKHCYAEGYAHRFFATLYPQIPMGPMLPDGGPTAWRDRSFTDVRTHEDRLLDPLSWTKPSRVFVNSMSDLFHEDVPDDFLVRVFAVMARAHQQGHTFIVLTKRPARMRAWLRDLGTLAKIKIAFDELATPKRTWGLTWPLANLWLGVSVEDQETADSRIPALLETPAMVRCVSYEPALGPIDFEAVPLPDLYLRMVGVRGCLQPLSEKDTEADDYRYWTRQLRKLHWVIVGGESGHGARPFLLAWARATVTQCRAAGVPVFVKQLGAQPYDGGTSCGDLHESPGAHSVHLHDKKGADLAEWPDDLRVQEFPA
jgi:protein gp37